MRVSFDFDRRDRWWWCACVAAAVFAALVHHTRSIATLACASIAAPRSESIRASGAAAAGQRAAPVLAVAIVTYRRHDMLEQLLHSIAAQETSFAFEVLVVDNGCLPETQRIVTQAFPWVRYLPQCSNVGYARANNLAAEHVSPTAEWLLFLNDDTELFRGFLHNMRLVQQLLEEGLNRTIGAIGCKSVWPDGRLMEAGSIVYNNGLTDNYGRRDSPDLPQYSFVRSVHYVSGACFMIRRSLYVELGGMQADKYEAYFEDTDLAMSIRHERNLPVVFNPFAVMLHDEHASFGAGATNQLMHRSRKTFVDRWAIKLKHFHPAVPDIADFDTAEEADPARFLLGRDARSASNPTMYHALYIADASTLEKFAPLLFYLQRIRTGQLVTLFVIHGDSRSRLGYALQALGVEVFAGNDQDLVKHIMSRRLFYQVACTVDDDRRPKELLPLFGGPVYHLDLSSQTSTQRGNGARPSLLKGLSHNKELAVQLLQASRRAARSFSDDVLAAVSRDAVLGRVARSWLDRLQDENTGIILPSRTNDRA